MHDTVARNRPPLWLAIRRGLACRCPNCGGGRLFASYLKQVDTCAACGEPLGHIRSDDAAPWLTILVVGHILVPIVLAVEMSTTWPDWVSMTLWPALGLALAVALLPRAKGLFVGVIWATGAPGSESD
jgi:uncharacterized protein (DUF983 family)